MRSKDTFNKIRIRAKIRRIDPRVISSKLIHRFDGSKNENFELEFTLLVLCSLENFLKKRRNPVYVRSVIHFRFFFPSFLFSLRKNYKSLPTMNFRADKMDVFQFFPNNSTNVYEITITGRMSKLYFPQNREITFPIIPILHG